MSRSSLSIVVTGAGSGLGRGLSAYFAAKGHRLFLTDLNLHAVQQTVAELGSAAERASAHALDVTSSAQVARFVASLGVERVDVLVNNAGLQHVSKIEDFPEAKWDLLIDVMLKGPFLMTRAILPRMRAAGYGRIINIGSIHSLVATPFKSAYTAAKHGVAGLSKAVALQTADADITVNTICPAYIRTPLVNVISMRKLREFWEERRSLNAESALRAWYKTCRLANWNGPSDVRETYRNADFVLVRSGRSATVFNVKGNHLRIIALINYVRKTMLITHVLTHREYDVERWKAEL